VRIQTEVEVQKNRMKLANNLIAIEWVWIFKNRGLTTVLATYMVLTLICSLGSTVFAKRTSICALYSVGSHF
jgi:hypothetical protein